ncbi:MAG: 50S ribosomal protein L23 [Candidatus Staskawiczbacteria bacterium]|nr:50S ribosomal protein L23 [Candidatus Staskawiczbacteria bacterium]
MALLDFLKKKKESEKARDVKKENIKKTDKPVKTLATEKPVRQKQVFVKDKKTTDFSYEVIKEPHISEKATMLSESNRYIFKVYPNTNKIEIKKAVEGVYGVNVLSVNIVKIHKKKRRLGKVQGFKSGYTKAIVKIRDGQKIEIL